MIPFGGSVDLDHQIPRCGYVIFHTPCSAGKVVTTTYWALGLTGMLCTAQQTQDAPSPVIVGSPLGFISQQARNANSHVVRMPTEHQFVDGGELLAVRSLDSFSSSVSSLYQSFSDWLRSFFTGIFSSIGMVLSEFGYLLSRNEG